MRRLAAALLGSLVVGMLQASATAACSPPLERPTIRALGPGQVVVLGMTGERAPGGRLFHVERWFNGQVPTTPIVIAFKEGEAIGDCSYPMGAGRPLIIAPDMAPDGTLSANLVTLQADPLSPDGQRYLAEATHLFGPGIVPTLTGPPAEAPLATPDTGLGLPAIVAILVGLATMIFGAVVVIDRWLRRPGRTRT